MSLGNDRTKTDKHLAKKPKEVVLKIMLYVQLLP